MTKAFDAADREIVVLDITSDLGIPTAQAISWRRSDGGRAHLGLGCHLEPRLAVSRALAELNQGAAWDFKAGKDDPPPAFDDARARWLKEATVENQPYLRPLAGAQRTAADFKDRSTRDVRDGTSVADLITELSLNGRRLAVELNQEVLPRESYAAQILAADDVIEIVNFIGGG